MITLYTFGPMWGLPDPSPFVMKTEVQLKLTGLPYQVQPMGLGDAPKGKLPYIVDAGETVADSVFIRDHLQRKYGLDLDAGLTPLQRAQAWMIERTLEDHLYWAIVNARWADDANFAAGPADFFNGAPEGVREQGREQVIRTLHGQGFGRHKFAEVGDLAHRSFAALSTTLGERPYLFGETASGADATAFATVAAALVPRFTSPVRDAVASFPNLVAYRDRLMARFFPDFAQPAMASAASTRLTHA
jgi:glutathione S-transferase